MQQQLFYVGSLFEEHTRTASCKIAVSDHHTATVVKKSGGSDEAEIKIAALSARNKDRRHVEPMIAAVGQQHVVVSSLDIGKSTDEIMSCEAHG